MKSRPISGCWLGQALLHPKGMETREGADLGRMSVIPLGGGCVCKRPAREARRQRPEAPGEGLAAQGGHQVTRGPPPVLTGMGTSCARAGRAPQPLRSPVGACSGHLPPRSAFLHPTAFPPNPHPIRKCHTPGAARQPIRSGILGLGPPEAPRTNGRLGIGGPIRSSVHRAEVAVGRAELRGRFSFGSRSGVRQRRQSSPW